MPCRTVDITLDGLAGDVLADVRLSSMTGEVRSEFDSLRLKKAPGTPMAGGNLGAGTGQVAVNTVSGAITLLRRPVRRREGNPPAAPRHAAADRRISSCAEDPRTQAGTESEIR